MTSRISFFKYVKLSFSQRVWNALTTTIIMLFMLPVAAMAFISMNANTYKYLENSSEFMRLYFRHMVLGVGNGAFFAGMVILAVCLAVGGYDYLFSKSKCDFYHSLPIKRTYLFFANYISGIVTFFVPYLVFTVITFFIGIGNHCILASDIGVVLETFFVNMVSFALLYAVSIMAVMLTGNNFAAVAGAFVFLIYGTMAEALLNMLKGTFYTTYSSYEPGADFSLICPFSAINKIRDLGGMNYDKPLNVMWLMLIVAGIIVITLISMWIYNKRPIETAGEAVIFSKIRAVIEVALLVVYGLFGGQAFSEISGNDFTMGKVFGTEGFSWFVSGAVMVVVIGHIIIQTIFYRDIKALGKNILNPIISIGIMMGICVFFGFDVPGFDKYVPDKNMESMAVVASSIEYSDYIDNSGAYDMEGTNWRGQGEYVFENMKFTDIEVSREFVEEAIKHTKQYAQLINSESDDENVSGWMYGWIDLDICVTQKGGNKIYRRYMVNMKEFIDHYNKIFVSPEYKNGIYQILNDSEICPEDKVVLEYPGEQKMLGTYSDSMCQEIVNAYKQDLMNQDIYDIAYNVPLAKIFLRHEVNGTGAGDMYDSCLEYSYCYIYPSFENTLAVIKASGYDIYQYMDIDNINSIVVTEYNYEADNPAEEMNVTEYTQRDDIEDILSKAKPEDYVWTNSFLRETEEADISVNYKNAFANGNKTVVLRYIKEN